MFTCSFFDVYFLVRFCTWWPKAFQLILNFVICPYGKLLVVSSLFSKLWDFLPVSFFFHGIYKSSWKHGRYRQHSGVTSSWAIISRAFCGLYVRLFYKYHCYVVPEGCPLADQSFQRYQWVIFTLRRNEWQGNNTSVDFMQAWSSHLRCSTLYIRYSKVIGISLQTDDLRSD